MTYKIQVKIYPINDDAKNWMKSSIDQTLERIYNSSYMSPLKSVLDWIQHPHFNATNKRVKMIRIEKTGESFSHISKIKGSPVYHATAEIPSNYFTEYKTTIEKGQRHKVIKI